MNQNDQSHMNNVILTCPELGGVGFFTSITSEAWNYQHPGPYKLRWRYESSRFEATRFRRTFPEGYLHTWNADPQILLKRGFDKVIVLQKTLEDSYIGMSLYFYANQIMGKIPEMHPKFYEVIKRKWEFMETYRDFDDPRFLYVHFDDLNNHTVKEFKKVFDFLEFPKENRPMMIPVKVWRNWECYSNIQKSGNEWFEERDPLFVIKEKYSKYGMFYDVFVKDLAFKLPIDIEMDMKEMEVLLANENN